jgi:hypothetical protein
MTTMDTDIRFNRLLIGNDSRFLGVMGIVAVIGAVLSWILLRQYTIAISTLLPLFFLLFFAYFVVSLAISFDGGGLLESFVLLIGPQFGLYSSVCAYIRPAFVGGSSTRTPQEPSVSCFAGGMSFPVLDVPVLDDVVVTSMVIALSLSIVSVGLGRLLRNQINTPLME